MNSKGKVLITGMNGFTGAYVAATLKNHSFNCFGLDCDLLDVQKVNNRVTSLGPDYVIHLAGKSFSAELDVASIYSSNVNGTLNLLDALIKLKTLPKKVIIASSASIYGDSKRSPIKESMIPKPINHYGCSKLSMEYMVEKYLDRLPILIARPFNYTGIGHSKKFLIPKIVNAYKDKLSSIELGNINVYREFNDVRDISLIYAKLITSSCLNGPINICSGRSISISEIIEHMNEISSSNMNVLTKERFMRENEIDNLTGSNEKLKASIQFDFKHSIKDTLHWMYSSASV
jgi:nucleoside-diphosphate-sugar epimerase